MERVFAQVDIGSTFTPAQNFDTIGSLVSVVSKNAFAIAGILTLILLILGGFGYIVAAGSGDAKKMEQGKSALTAAVMGLFLVIGSFWALQVIEILTGMRGKLLPLQ